MWQWWNYCSGQAPADEIAMTINLDENSTCLFQGGWCHGKLFDIFALADAMAICDGRCDAAARNRHPAGGLHQMSQV